MEKEKVARLKELVKIKKQMNEQLDDMYHRYDYSLNYLDEVKKLFNNMVEKYESGIKISNLKEVELKPEVKVNVPDVHIPEIKIPEAKINIPAPTVIKEEDVFSQYKPADVMEDNNTKYYGYVAKSGEWFIMREVNNNNNIKYRYASGKGNYPEAFIKRAKQDYKYFDEAKL